MATTALDLQRADLTALLATVTALHGLDTPKAKGMFLCQRFRERPRLASYFKACYDPSRKYQFSSKDIDYSIDYPVPSYETTALMALGNHVKEHTNKNVAINDFAVATEGLPKELRHLACMILDRDLRCEVDVPLLNKVFERCNIDPITPAEETSPQTVIEVTGTGGGSTQAALWHGQTRVGNMVFYHGPALKACLAQLQANGVVVKGLPKDNPEGMRKKG